ncbi:MAG: ComF family protein [Clostridium sp.]|nr:ComF family protein [Acetatifactor muris]MCM1526759.1 ComF family protein [Bacteroides sp.]MCM1562781.1 ComF family protein [Clostridium sp.]
MKDWPDTVKQMLFPLRCPVCDGIVTPRGAGICPDCAPRLKLLTPPYCLKCGKKLRDEREFCADCSGASHVFDRGRALYEYESAAGSIYRLKYGGRQEYADFLGEEMARYLGAFVGETAPDALIPIPLHPARQRGRGYNQAALLAESVGRRLDVPVRAKYLSRVRNTKPLKYLNPKERQNNLKRAFNIDQNDVKLKTVILVDDIYTTGSTMDEAAATLKAGGVERVYFIALACGAGV